ncbi:MAG: PH domain-containing protein [Patescibacteria group bacterium]|nr:PH domain-containing protein [Patescibacteria group bacterium]
MFKIKLRENEKLILASRQTEWVWGKAVLMVFVLIYLPWAFYAKYDLQDITAFRRILLFWTVLVLLYALNKYLLWLVNAYLVTNQRVISVEYKNLFSKTVEEVDLQSVAAISCKTQGILESLFKTGKVIITFSNASKTFVLDKIREPEDLKETILKAKALNSAVHV